MSAHVQQNDSSMQADQVVSSLCILNLTEPRIEVVEFSFPRRSTTVTNSLLAIPQDVRLVLYIVAHGVPDGFLVGEPPALFSDSALAEAIRGRRGRAPTLCVWDLCYAETFHVTDFDLWPDNFAHIFACRPWERTWHSGFRQGAPSPHSVFSSQLERAILDCKADGRLDWVNLELRLQAYLSPVQAPTISASDQHAPAQYFGV